MASATSPLPETGVFLRCRVHPWSPILLLCKTTVVIDGQPSRVSWGEHFFATTPGQHEVNVSFKYLTEEIGQAGIVVEVPKGQVVRVNYQSPAMFSLMLTSKRGTITLTGS